MKSITIMNKIKNENSCSIARVELLTKALHRENKLPVGQAIRFKPLFGTFDIVNADLFITGNFNTELCDNTEMNINDLINKYK